jgi:integrase
VSERQELAAIIPAPAREFRPFELRDLPPACTVSTGTTESSGPKGGSMARRRYQKGCVILRGDVWYGRYRDDVIGQDGKVTRVLRNTVLGSKKEYPTKRLAERKLELLLHRINAPEYRPGRVATVAEFAERWQFEILSRRKPSTREAANSHLAVHIIPFMGKQRLDAIGVEHQQAFVTKLAESVSPKTLVNVLGTLSSMLTTAKNWGYICEGVSLKRLALPERGVKREVRCFTANEVRRILEAAKEPWRTMFAIAALLGLRAGEVLGLRTEDIDLPARTLNITQTAWYGQIQTTKTKESENSLPIPDALCELLRPHLSKPGLLFVNKVGRPYTAEKVVQKRLWPILEALKIQRAGFHAFRHAHASLLLEGGASPKVAQRQLRHSDARITLGIYAHLVEDSHREAVEKLASNLFPIVPIPEVKSKWTQ